MFDVNVKHSSDIRVNNKKAIINQLMSEPKTKKQIANDTGLSIATASNLCNELIQQGFLYSNSTNNSDGGRIPQQFFIKEDSRYAVCLNMVEYDIITLAVTDIVGNVIFQEAINSESATSAESLIEFSTACINETLKKLGIDISLVIGIGVAVGGNELEGVNTIQNCYGHPLLENANIRWYLEKNFPSVPVYIDNVANEVALALNHKHPEVDDLVYLYIGDSVGVGIISDGKLLRGSHGVGGEINHLQLGGNGYTCYCGQKNCIETEMSIIGFQRKFFDSSHIDHEINRYGWEIFEDAVKRDDVHALRVIEENGRMIGKTISLLSQLFDAPSYWIGGFDSYIYSRLYPYIMEELEARSIFRHLFSYDVHFDEGFHTIISKGCYELAFRNWYPIDSK